MVKIRDISKGGDSQPIRIPMEAKTFLEAVKRLNRLNSMGAAVLYMRDDSIRQSDKIQALTMRLNDAEARLKAAGV